jgi:DNA mismatch repair protein MutL
MPSKIRVLNEKSINVIAAGEVIENPSSVVKELVENAIDAGSTEISVEIRGGGRQLIRITDNGCGMNSDDALLCFERHATSKIRSAEDLGEICTMGFRGEAIPSIAAISKFALITRPHDGDAEASMVIVEGGKILKCCSAARSPGTTIEVKSLFYNVAVRRKFQKSPAYDQGEIVKTMTLLALGHPSIKFQLLSDGVALVNAPIHNSFAERIRDTLGADFLENSYPLNFEDGAIRLSGFIGFPYASRPNRTGQHLFINGRSVFAPLVSRAIKEGYGTTMGAQRFPVFVLHLSLPGKLIDVNVHPQKREVRLREAARLKDLIFHAVENALHGPEERVEEISFITPPQQTTGWSETEWTPTPPRPQASELQQSIPFPSLPDPVDEDFVPAAQPHRPRVIATLTGYFLVENFDKNLSWVLFDQKAVHARILFERLSGHSSLAVETQPLLLPITLDLSSPEALFVQDHLQYLRDIGFDIHECGPNSFMVNTLPRYCDPEDAQDIIYQLVEELRESQNTRIPQHAREQHLAEAASRASIAREKRLSLEEAQTLVSQLIQCQTTTQCPRGKPLWVELSPENLSKFFHLS